jgi:hypothetical protein
MNQHERCTRDQMLQVIQEYDCWVFDCDGKQTKRHLLSYTSYANTLDSSVRLATSIWQWWQRFHLPGVLLFAETMLTCIPCEFVNPTDLSRQPRNERPAISQGF